MTPPSVSFYFRGIFVATGLMFWAGCRQEQGPAVAKVGDKTITLADFQSRLRDTPPAYQTYVTTPEGRRQFLNILIREKLLLIEAKKAGLHNEENYKKAVDRFKTKWQHELRDYQDSLLVEMYLGRLRSTAISVTDADVRAYYDQHATDYTHPVEIQASHILVSTPDKAEQALARVKAGEPFEVVAQSMSMDPTTAVRGGKLAPYTPGSLMPEFESAVAPLRNGQVSGIVKTPFGYHIIKKLGQRSLPAKSLDQAKGEIETRLQRQKFEQWAAQKQATLGVKIDEPTMAAAAAAPLDGSSAGQPNAAASAREMEPVR